MQDIICSNAVALTNLSASCCDLVAGIQGGNSLSRSIVRGVCLLPCGSELWVSRVKYATILASGHHCTRKIERLVRGHSHGKKPYSFHLSHSHHALLVPLLLEDMTDEIDEIRVVDCKRDGICWTKFGGDSCPPTTVKSHMGLSHDNFLNGQL